MEQRRRRRPCCIGCVGLLVLATVPLWLYVFSHDWNLWRFRREFARLEHPRATKMIARSSELGLLIAASNHIDYFVGQMRSYTGPRVAIRRYYKSRTVWNPIAHRRDSVELLFADEFRKGPLTDFEWPDPVLELLEKSRETGLPSNRLYIVYVFDGGYPCGLDIRGI